MTCVDDRDVSVIELDTPHRCENLTPRVKVLAAHGGRSVWCAAGESRLAYILTL